MPKFTIKDFNTQYPNDEACLDEIFTARYGNISLCPSCKMKTKFHRASERKCYYCQQCGYHLYPLAGTIFHKSSTSLKNWFFALYLFSNSKNGVSAKELERQLGVTYKCAWRIAKQLRLLFSQSNVKQLFGTIEADETYIGGKRSGKRGRGAENKKAVLGLVQRKGSVKAQVVDNVKVKTIQPLINENVAKGSTMMTDEFLSYNKVSRSGYDHKKIRHAIKEYVRGEVHTNSIEGFWSQLKRSINGTYHAVSPKYLQSYVDEFAYRYNHRVSEFPLFYHALAEVVRLS